MKMFRTLFVLAIVAALSASVAIAQPAAKANLKSPAAMKEEAPAIFKASFETTKGTFVIEVHRDWAPVGADRFYNLVKNGFYDDCQLFRVVPGFMVQFGIHGDPAVSAAWMSARIQDDPPKQSNKRGYITFAKGGPNSRTTQVFINFADNAFLDKDFAPFGQVVSGMVVVDSFNAKYGEKTTSDQGNIYQKGNPYLTATYPGLDVIKKATIVQ